MPVLACYFTFAGLLPFTVLLFQTARRAAQRLADPSPAGAGDIAVSTFVVMVFAAIDTAFVLLLIRTIAVALRPGGLS